jgi:hypothetical protein
MKKLTLTLATLALLTLSCSKEESLPEPTTTQNNQNCNCGLIVSDESSDYSIQIRNSCSGNVKKFVLYEADWMTAYVGTNYCITNTSGW